MSKTDRRTHTFQYCFVREQCPSAAKGIYFEEARTAGPSPGFIHALQRNGVSAVIICPSNLYLSVDPLLAIPDVPEAAEQADKVRVAGAEPLIALSILTSDQDRISLARHTLTFARAPADCDGGTGALAFPAQCSIPLAFGPDSFAHHIAAAVNHGFKACTMQAPSLSLISTAPPTSMLC